MQVFGEDNYDGPDITYYFDAKETPPFGPDDDEKEGGRSYITAGRREAMKYYKAYNTLKAAEKQSQVIMS